jgi:hypothetical protein
MQFQESGLIGKLGSRQFKTGKNEPMNIPSAIGHVAIAIAFVFLAVKSVMFFLHGQAAAGGIFALFAACVVIGALLGQRYRFTLDRRRDR